MQIRDIAAANNAWSRPRLSTLVKSRLFGFDGRFVQRDGSANPARRLTLAVSQNRL